MKSPAVYIMASRRNDTIYAGVTSNLSKSVWQHREGTMPGFTKRYKCTLLVWYESYERMDEAIAREKQIKAGSRRKKLDLIEALNPEWRDLYEDFAEKSGLLRRHAPRSDGPTRTPSLRAQRSNPVFRDTAVWIASSRCSSQ